MVEVKDNVVSKWRLALRVLLEAPLDYVARHKINVERISHFVVRPKQGARGPPVDFAGKVQEVTTKSLACVAQFNDMHLCAMGVDSIKHSINVWGELHFELSLVGILRLDKKDAENVFLAIVAIHHVLPVHLRGVGIFLALEHCLTETSPHWLLFDLARPSYPPLYPPPRLGETMVRVKPEPTEGKKQHDEFDRFASKMRAYHDDDLRKEKQRESLPVSVRDVDQ